jgi:membrane-associated phospholipid phosphatase
LRFRLTREEWKRSLFKCALLLLVVVYHLGGYFLLNEFSVRRATYHTLYLPFERDIPLIPFFSLGYTFHFLNLTILFFLVERRRDVVRAAKGILIVSTLCFVVFYFYPVKMVLRPESLTGHSFLLELTRFYYDIDQPYNLFPSLHVAMSTMAAVYCLQIRPTWGVFCALLALFVAVSVVFMKQHYIADVLGGFLVGGISIRLSSIEFSRKIERTWTHLFERPKT